MGALSYEQWSQEDWKDVDFGDKRLNSRAVRIGADFLRNPFVSPPKMFKDWDKIKAFYRFINSTKVTHHTLTLKHMSKAKYTMQGNTIILAVQDSSTINLKRNYEIEGSYDVGNIPGVLIHNMISVVPHQNYGIIGGLLKQIVHKRKPKEERTEQESEISLWTDSINEIGEPPKGTTIVDVMDRASDALRVMHCSLKNKHEFLLRARANRYINENDHRYLFEFARDIPTAGYTTLKIKGKAGKKTRVAKLRIAFSPVHIDTPKNDPAQAPLLCNIVHVQEIKASQDDDQLEWFLLTSLQVNCFDDALQATKWYTYRWVIEEYHKCLKTGFRLEETQLQTLKAIEALLGFIAVASVRLLQLRDIVRVHPTANATDYVEQEDVNLILNYYKLPKTPITIDRFLRLIAQLGGFINRKGDGNPGWQTLWEGWKYFLGLKEGARLYKEEKICG